MNEDEPRGRETGSSGPEGVDASAGSGADARPDRSAPERSDDVPGRVQARDGRDGERVPGWRAVFGAFGIGLLGALMGTVVGLNLGAPQGALLLLAEVGTFAGVLYYLARSRYPAAAALRWRPVPRKIYGLAVRLGVALLLANFAATTLLGPAVQQIEIDVTGMGTVERLMFVLAVALVAPVAEECLFRGLLQGVLERRLTGPAAIVLAALPFALLHGLPGPALVIFFWTLPLGWITWRTRSIAPGLVVHLMNNSVGALSLFFVGEPPSGMPELTPEARVLIVGLLLAGALWAVRLCVRIGRSAGRSSGRNIGSGGP